MAHSAGPQAGVAVTSAGPIEPKLLAVITAAVVAMLGSGARVRRVMRLNRDSSGWANTGRSSMHASHLVTRHRT